MRSTPSAVTARFVGHSTSASRARHRRSACTRFADRQHGLGSATSVGSSAQDTATGPMEPAELLDDDVHELASVTSALAIRRSQAAPSIQSRFNPTPGHRPRTTVELGELERRRDLGAGPTQPPRAVRSAACDARRTCASGDAAAPRNGPSSARTHRWRASHAIRRCATEQPADASRPPQRSSLRVAHAFTHQWLAETASAMRYRAVSIGLLEVRMTSAP